MAWVNIVFLIFIAIGAVAFFTVIGLIIRDFIKKKKDNRQLELQIKELKKNWL